MKCRRCHLEPSALVRFKGDLCERCWGSVPCAVCRELFLYRPGPSLIAIRACGCGAGHHVVCNFCVRTFALAPDPGFPALSRCPGGVARAWDGLLAAQAVMGIDGRPGTNRRHVADLLAGEAR